MTPQNHEHPKAGRTTSSTEAASAPPTVVPDQTPNKPAESGQWAPFDYTDGRAPLDWRSKFPPEARKHIRREAWYLFLVFLICLVATFYMLYLADAVSATPVSPPAQGGQPGPSPSGSCFMGYICAWISGTLGGCVFGIKWMYHIVAKVTWHEERRLWRLLSPHVSGAVALFMVLLVSSGLLKLFDKGFAQRYTEVMAFGFLVGYFSDRALAKMAEVADTMFGAAKDSSPRKS